MDWNPRLESLSTIFPKLTAGGITPTGPAIKEATHYFTKKRSLRGLLKNNEQYIEESGM
jgi:Ca-activated chloride channel family protein